MPPVMRPPKRGVTYSEAIAAAYASAPETEIVLDTLEIHHASFIDDFGAPFAIRVVNDHEPLTATLEAGAPMNPGAAVLFKACYFEFRRPSETESGSLPEVELSISNVSRLIIPHLDRIKESRSVVTVIWRPYLVSDLSGPHMNPPLALTLRYIQADMNNLTARAGFTDLSNRRFPASEYTAKKFPQLVIR